MRPISSKALGRGRGLAAVCAACALALTRGRPAAGAVRPLAWGRLKTAIASSPESATSRRRPSRVTDSAVGEVPRPPGRPTDSVRCTASRLVSSTTTTSWLAIAT